MTPDASAAAGDSGAEVMASVDSTPDGTQFVIADITRDEAWIAVAEADASPLPAWR
jgi:hypothetical protein